MLQNHRVTVIIPNYNGTALLPACLGSLRGQTFRDFETLVIDNGSTDASVELIKRDYPEVRLIEMGENRVFSGAVNAGIRATESPLVALLNNDTEVVPGWLGALVEILDAHPEAGMCASRMMLFDRRNVFHSAGDFYSPDGIPVNRGVWCEDTGQYRQVEYVFGGCGGAVLYRREMLDRIGLLDEDMVAYCEDVDLNWRAQLAGYRAMYAPEAVVYHRLSATGGGSFASYYCGRNFVVILARDLPGGVWRKHWRRILRAQLSFTFSSLRHVREPAARARLRGQLVGLLRLPKALTQRAAVQKTRVVDDEYLFSLLERAREGCSAS